MRDRLTWALFLSCLLAGCQTAGSVGKVPVESREEIQRSLGAVAGAVTGKELSTQDIKNLEKQLRTNKEARSAVESITNSMEGRPGNIKYCPLTGKRYASMITICPEHGEELKTLVE